jgi:AbrB family looped-hinge helix DNA binding protein
MVVESIIIIASGLDLAGGVAEYAELFRDVRRRLIGKVMAKHRTSKPSTKNQISIPKSVRAARGWRPGQVFAFLPKRAGVLIVPVPELDDLCGIARGAVTEGYRDRRDRV